MTPTTYPRVVKFCWLIEAPRLLSRCSSCNSRIELRRLHWLNAGKNLQWLLLEHIEENKKCFLKYLNRCFDIFTSFGDVWVMFLIETKRFYTEWHLNEYSGQQHNLCKTRPVCSYTSWGPRKGQPKAHETCGWWLHCGTSPGHLQYRMSKLLHR